MNKIYNHKIVINKEQSLLRLDQALAKLTSYSRSQIKILLSNDNILKNEEIIKDASYKVKSGEKYIINIKIPELEKFDAEQIPLDIIYEDNEIIVVNKKAGMVVHPSPGHYHGTLVNALINHTKNADILIVAVGNPEFINESMVKEGSIVIDVGINRVKDFSNKKGYRITGDVNFDSVINKVSMITPVPGGVGPMTIAMLLENVLKSSS